jgi:hypothetical protein
MSGGESHIHDVTSNLKDRFTMDMSKPASMTIDGIKTGMLNEGIKPPPLEAVSPTIFNTNQKLTKNGT